MASSNLEIQERYRLYKFTKVLTLKVAQIVVQSRQGKKITHECNPRLAETNADVSPPLQWFNLSIPDEAAVNAETQHVLNGEVADALANMLCIEISLRTTEREGMVLELWTVKLLPGTELCSPSTVYYRMSVMLKSTLTISRITPAYKLARAQHKDSYEIYHKIYGGEPDYDSLLGKKNKKIKVSELHTPIGTLVIEVVFRTDMTILPANNQPRDTHHPHNNIVLKNDHFNTDTPKWYERKECDLSRPLTAGAFVDVAEMRELRDALSRRLPPAPRAPASAPLLPPGTHCLEQHMERLALDERSECARAETPAAGSLPVQVPARTDHLARPLMEFPFAEGSPISELAGFYRECLAARALPAECWGAGEVSDLARQLRDAEDAAPEFDDLLADMCADQYRAAPAPP